MANFNSHHNIIDVTIMTCSPGTSHTTEIYTYRNYKAIDPTELNNFLANCNWSPFLTDISNTNNNTDTINLDNIVTCLTSNFTDAIENLAPLKTRGTHTKNREPWIDDELDVLYNKRDAVRKRYKRTKGNRLWEEYLDLASEADELSTQARNSFLQNKIFIALNGGKDIWTELRHLGLLPISGHDTHGFTADELN